MASPSVSERGVFTVTNVAPSVSILGIPAGSVTEGTAISLTSLVSDPSSADTAAGFLYSWSVKKNGNPFGSTGSASAFSFTPTDNGTYVVEVVDTGGPSGLGEPAGNGTPSVWIKAKLTYSL